MKTVLSLNRSDKHPNKQVWTVCQVTYRNKYSTRIHRTFSYEILLGNSESEAKVSSDSRENNNIYVYIQNNRIYCENLRERTKTEVIILAIFDAAVALQTTDSIHRRRMEIEKKIKSREI